MRRLFLVLWYLCLVAINLASQSSRYAETSVLSKGNWYKIQVDKSGVHKLTYEQLVQMGINNPEKVSVFGYGGAQLSEYFLDPYIDDLPQLSIYMEKGNDGVFGAGDYILFYAQGPVSWTYNTKKLIFEHKVNTYSNYGYYFVTSDVENQKHIKKQEALTANVTNPIVAFDDYYLYEKDEINLLNSGRVYLGDVFNTSKLSRTFNVAIPNILAKTASVRVSIAHVDVSPATVKVEIGDSLLGNINLTQRPGNKTVAVMADEKYEFMPKKTTGFDLKLTYSNSASTAYLNYFVLNFKRELKKTNSESLAFRFADNVGTNKNYVYNLYDVNSNVQIWDVTDKQNIVEIPASLSNTTMSFVDTKSVLKEYVAVDVKSDKFLEPKIIGKIQNQDLHALGQADMIIISPIEFVDAAQKLADIHSEYDGLTTHIVDPEIIYNEFSSGTPDATAYRRFVKMFYDRAKTVANPPKYLLLFGDGMFDNRQILKANTDRNLYRLLTYQAEESFTETSSYTTDDYFGFLDDTEGRRILMDLMDIAVGRIPVYSKEQANGVVEKLISYIKNEDLGEWKNRAVFLADDGDNNEHISGMDSVCNYIQNLNPNLLTRKLYLDSYTQEVSAVGETYPMLKKEFVDYINNGMLFINYMGHSGYNNWTNEQILTVTDIESMYNKRLPLFITASCSFSRFDDFKDSGGEVLMTNEAGGALALISASRTVFAQPNLLLNLEIAKELLKYNEKTKQINTIGEAYQLAKNKRAKSSDSNRLGFVFIGDPAIRLAYPYTHIAKIDSINGKNIAATVDTIGALGIVRMSGSIKLKEDNSVDKTFNGYAHISVFDKEEIIETLCNDATASSNNVPFVYTYRTSPIYSGQVMVKDGLFNVEFIMPKDIRYNFGEGRVVIYAADETQGFEANGNCQKMIIGGEDENAVLEIEGPELSIYLNTPYFKNGDQVDPNPLFVAELKDISGINTIGSGIGHDIILKLDNDPNQEFVLNTYYESLFGAYNQGVVNYPLNNLQPGKHRLFFRVWDLQNNSSSAELEFEVVSEIDVELKNMYVYPNPVQNVANIVIEHDKPLNPIDVQLFIYDISGRMIWKDSYSLVTDASSSIKLNWDVNSCITDGLLFVKAIVTDLNGKKDSKTTKIFVSKQ